MRHILSVSFMRVLHNLLSILSERFFDTALVICQPLHLRYIVLFFPLFFDIAGNYLRD